MSMISEQVADLREKAQVFEDSGCATNGIVKTFREAADTIEKLSAKLADVNMERSTAYYNDGWIPCSERLPVYYDWHHVTVKPFYEGRENYVAVERYDRIKGEWSFHERAYKDKIIAWKPKPEPYEGVE